MDIFEKYPNSIFLKGLHQDSDFFPLRERIDELFCSLDGLEDPHFEQGLDQDPHARLWEMMLAKIIKSEGYQPASADHGPDFVVEKDGKRVFIEAVCPGPGDENNPNSVPSIVSGARIAQAAPEAQIILRICSALDEKKRKYAQYLEQGIVSENDICVIAVNLSKIDSAFGLWPPAIIRATHGLGGPCVIFGRDGEVVDQGIKSCKSITKVNGEEIGTSFLLSEDNSLISAVLYSGCSFSSFPFDLFEESMLIHNPKARVPLPLGFIKRIEDIWTICSHDDLQWRAYRINNARQMVGCNGTSAVPQP